MKTSARKNTFALIRRHGAWTLIELLIVMFISGILLTVVAALTVNTARSIYAMSNYTQMDQASRQALDILTRDVRQAWQLSAWSKTNIEGTAVGANGAGVFFSYSYSATKGTMTRTWNGQSTTLLTNCDSLTFAVYQRTPTNNFQFYQTSIPAEAKLLDVTWKCSRQIKGVKVNTETIQTAKIVIRN
jgi:Tfp pilus assembly protein PilW